ncbi:MAG: adenine deaminase [Lachnospiraceae bacterium]|nr:adenine deaminase [Lachnospiraceae bacterium]
MQNRKHLISVARGEQKADLVLKGGRIFNVFTGELEEGNLAICDGRIAGIERRDDLATGTGCGEDLTAGKVCNANMGHYEGFTELDVSGKILCPGLMDGHIHVESSMLSPVEFAKAVLPHGTTAVVTDPHEIANVAGAEGIRFMMESSKNLPMDLYFMMPSCVPATALDESGAELTAADLKAFYEDDRVLGLAELMNAFGTVRGEEGILAKIADVKAANKIIDGHAPDLTGKELNAYIVAGAQSDHECSTAEEALEKLRKGQWIMIRQGTAAKNLQALLPLFDDRYFARCILVTDDKHPGDLIYQGHMDHIIREAVRAGKKPENAIRMATINTATYFGLTGRGALAPGCLADVIVVSSLEDFRVEKVFKAGRLVAEDGKVRLENFCTEKAFKAEEPVAEDGRVCTEGMSGLAVSTENLGEAYPAVRHSFHVRELRPEDFALKETGRWTRVLELTPGELLTKERILSSKLENAANLDRQGQNMAAPDMGIEAADGKAVAPGVETDLDIIKIAVIERHKNTGHVGVGFVSGYGLTRGAIASSIAHDSHNLIVAGTNDVDMAVAANAVRENEGGLAIAVDGAVLSSLPLPLGGLMSELSAAAVEEVLLHMKSQARALGVPEGIDPFMTLAFTALPVIPKLRILTKGLVDVEAQAYVPTVFD